MELSTVIGLASAVFAVVATILIEGGSLLSFVNISAITLILGGSFAVGLVSYNVEQMFSIPKYIIRTIFPPDLNYKNLISTLVAYAEKARREGLLSLEDEINNIDDEMMNLGLGLVVDGTDPDYIKDILQDLSENIYEDAKVAPELFECIGGFSPTLGIIGTVMGLVHVLERLSDSGMEALGRGIAVAFIATFYGIGFANLLWMPIANKLKFINSRIKTKNAIIIDGLLGIQSGNNPRVIMDKLLCCIKESDVRKKIRKEVTVE